MPIHLVLLANIWVMSLWLVLPFVVVLFLACLLHFMLLFCHLFFSFTFYCYVCLQNVSVLRSCTWPLFVFHPICFCFCVFFLSVFCHCHRDCHALPCFAEVGQAVWKVGVAMWGSKVNTFLDRWLLRVFSEIHMELWQNNDDWDKDVQQIRSNYERGLKLTSMRSADCKLFLGPIKTDNGLFFCNGNYIFETTLWGLHGYWKEV